MLVTSDVSSMNRSLFPDTRHHFWVFENSYWGSPRFPSASLIPRQSGVSMSHERFVNSGEDTHT